MPIAYSLLVINLRYKLKDSFEIQRNKRMYCVLFMYNFIILLIDLFVCFLIVI